MQQRPSVAAWIACVILACPVASSQHLGLQTPCAHDQCMAAAHAADPNLAAWRAMIEAQTQQALASGIRHSFPDVIRIPVVWHVVYATPAQNIPAARIHEQMAVLNTDFNALNPDLASVAAPFQGVIGNANIRFELAQRDPAGNPTNAITRTSTTIMGFPGNATVMSSATGGADGWPASDYLNIWVADIPGFAGFAWLPGGGTDGVVMSYAYVGNAGTAPTLGRTAVHEVGHWLNLHHTWGPSGSTCAQDDLVSDTPSSDGPAWCNSTFTTCGSLDMVNNYMNYGTLCRYAFTQGQVDRMRSLFVPGAYRASLRSSPALDPDYQLNQPPNASLHATVGGVTAPVATPYEFSSISIAPGQFGTVELNSTSGANPFEVGVSTDAIVAVSGAGTLTPGGQAINIDLTSPTTFYFNGGASPLLSTWTGNLSVPFSGTVPVSVFSAQMMKVDPGNLDGYYLSQAAQVDVAPTPCITVEALGSNSYNAITGAGFWRIIHNGACAPIAEVRLDGSTMPYFGSAFSFDVDQTSMADRFDGGNSTTSGCGGTYRNNSDVGCGLVYDGLNWPSCDPAANSGFIGERVRPTLTGNNVDRLTFRFAGGLFTGRSFEFDADTDGGTGTAGGDMAGMIVRVTLTNGEVYQGFLVTDTATRSFVDLN